MSLDPDGNASSDRISVTRSQKESGYSLALERGARADHRSYTVLVEHIIGGRSWYDFRLETRIPPVGISKCVMADAVSKPHAMTFVSDESVISSVPYNNPLYLRSPGSGLHHMEVDAVAPRNRASEWRGVGYRMAWPTVPNRGVANELWPRRSDPYVTSTGGRALDPDIPRKVENLRTEPDPRLDRNLGMLEARWRSQRDAPRQPIDGRHRPGVIREVMVEICGAERRRQNDFVADPPPSRFILERNAGGPGRDPSSSSCPGPLWRPRDVQDACPRHPEAHIGGQDVHTTAYEALLVDLGEQEAVDYGGSPGSNPQPAANDDIARASQRDAPPRMEEKRPPALDENSSNLGVDVQNDLL